MKTLVVYYSRTGHTDRLAREIAVRCQADIERISDDQIDRTGLRGYLQSGWQAFSGATPAIRAATLNPGHYELVVIGTPIWNWHLAAPVRTYTTRHAGEFKRVAFFCTEGGAGESRAFAELQRICGKPPLATLAVKEDELDPSRHAQPLQRFLAQLQP